MSTQATQTYCTPSCEPGLRHRKVAPISFTYSVGSQTPGPHMCRASPLPGNHISHTALITKLVFETRSHSYVVHVGLDFTTINEGRDRGVEECGFEPQICRLGLWKETGPQLPPLNRAMDWHLSYEIGGKIKCREGVMSQLVESSKSKQEDNKCSINSSHSCSCASAHLQLAFPTPDWPPEPVQHFLPH